MAINIVHALREKLGLPIEKIDVKAQHQNRTENPDNSDDLSQAATAAILVGIFKFSRTDTGANIIATENSANWFQTIFEDNEEEVAERVANYATMGLPKTNTYLEQIAAVAIGLIKENVKPLDAAGVKGFMSEQRHEVLVHLPAGLRMGKILEDETLDDRTNKMEGPVSSFLHWIEKQFSGDETK